MVAEDDFKTRLEAALNADYVDNAFNAREGDADFWAPEEVPPAEAEKLPWLAIERMDGLAPADLWKVDGERKGGQMVGPLLITSPRLMNIAENTFAASFPYEIAMNRLQGIGPQVGKYKTEGYAPQAEDIKKYADSFNIDSRYFDFLASAQSELDLEERARFVGDRIVKEQKMFESNTGLGGFATIAAVGMADPVFWVSGGVAGTVFKVGQSGTRFGNALRAAGAGAVGDGTIEFARTAWDPGQTKEMAAFATIGSMLLSGAFGALGKGVDKVDLDELDNALTKSMEANAAKGSLSSAQANPVPRTAPDVDVDATPAPPRAGPLTYGTPLHRLARAADPLVRKVADKLSSNPVIRGVRKVSAWEATRRINDAAGPHFREMQMAAQEYFKGRGEASVFGGINPEQFAEFGRIVGEVVHGARKSEDPHILRAAKAVEAMVEDTLAHVQDPDYVPGVTPITRDWTGGGSKPPSGTGPAPDEGAKAPTEGGNKYLGRKSFRGGGEAKSESPYEASDLEQVTDVSDQARARIIDDYMQMVAKHQTGEAYKKPSSNGIAYEAAGSVGGAATGYLAEELADAPEGLGEGLVIAGAIMGLVGGRAARRAAVRNWERNTPGVGFLVGRRHPGANQKKLTKARKMEAEGKSPDEIWRATGWGRFGPARVWVSEVTEPMLWVKEALSTAPKNIQDVLNVDRLSKAAPEVREIGVQTAWLLDMVKRNGWNGVAEVDIQKKLADIAIDPDLPINDQVEALAHEVQHIIGENAGLGYGVSPERLAEMGAEDPLFLYVTNASELAARLTGLRAGMSAKERLAKPIWYDYDVPEEELWSSFELAEAASVGSHIKAMRTPEWKAKNVTETVDENGLPYFSAKLPNGDGVDVHLVDYGDGTYEIEWDWTSNNWSMDVRTDKSMADSQQAFAAVHSIAEDLFAKGDGKTFVFSGLKDDTAKLQEALLRRRREDGYDVGMAAFANGKTKKNGEPSYTTFFAMVPKESGLNAEEVAQSMKPRSKAAKTGKVERIEERRALAASTRGGPQGPAAQQGPGEYRGHVDFEDIVNDPKKYGMPRLFSETGWRSVKTALARMAPDGTIDFSEISRRISSVFMRNAENLQWFDDLGRRMGMTAQEVSDRMAKRYVDTVERVMNTAKKNQPLFRKVSQGDRDAAREIVREVFNDGAEFGTATEEAMEMLLDLIAPIRKGSAESPRARNRMRMDLDAEQDADIMPMFEMDIFKVLPQYRRHMSGLAGLLRAGYRSVAELNAEIAKIEQKATLVSGAAEKRYRKEIALIEQLRDGVLGVPPEEMVNNREWSWFVDNMNRYHNARLMSNTSWLGLAEVAGAAVNVGPLRLIKRIGDYRRYIKRIRAGDERAAEEFFHAADLIFGHGSAQVRARMHIEADPVDNFVDTVGAGRTLQERAGQAVTTFTRKSSNAMGRLSGLSGMAEYLRMTMVTGEADEWAKAAAKGRAPYSKRRMEAFGIDESMWRRIARQMRKHTSEIESPTTKRPVVFHNINAWDDTEALNAFIGALDRNSRRIVLEGDLGSQPFWLRNSPWARMVFKFFNYPLNAYSKYLGFTLNVRDMRALSEFSAMTIMGTVGWTARTLLTAQAMDDPKEREKYLDDRLYDYENDRIRWGKVAQGTVYYSPWASIFPNIWDTGVEAANAMGAPIPMEAAFGNVRSSGTGLGTTPWTGNPTIDLITKSGPNAIGGLSKGTPLSEQDFQRIGRTFAPLGNFIPLVALTNRALEFLPDETGDENEDN